MMVSEAIRFNGNEVYCHTVLGSIKFKKCRKCGTRFARWSMKLFDRELGNFTVHVPLLRRGYCKECFINEWKKMGEEQ